MWIRISIWVVVMSVAGLPVRGEVTRYLTGNPADVTPALFGPAHAFLGGGGETDDPIQWMINSVRGCTDCPARLDVVVLRSSGADGYNPPIYVLDGVDSVETLVITSARDANREEIALTVQRGEVIFFAGGDQCNYVKYMKGTKVEAAVEAVYARGGGVGGTSAGYAIQTPFVYDACSGGSSQSVDALRDPYHQDISFTHDFFHWQYLEATFADTHFVERDRLGRLLAFLARQFVDGHTSKSILGLGVDAGTALLVDRNGLARVSGTGPVVLVLAERPADVCEPQTPLTYCDLKVWKFEEGDTFSLRDRPKNGYCLMDVSQGVIADRP